MSFLHGEAASAASANVQRRLARRRSLPRAAPPPLPTLAVGAHRLHARCIAAEEIARLTTLYAALIQRFGNEVQGHGAHEWRASRNYMYGGERCISDDASAPSAAAEAGVFEPLMSALDASGIVDGTMNGNAVELDSVCGHLYDAEDAKGEDGSSWYRHRDYCADDSLAALSIIIEGSLPHAGGALEMSGRDETAAVDVVALQPGDALVLRQAWHKPRPITSGRRVSFVFFFKRTPRRF